MSSFFIFMGGSLSGEEKSTTTQQVKLKTALLSHHADVAMPISHLIFIFNKG
jgi:hypothetical protein